MTLTAIVAMTPERVIGRDNRLPWHLPEDLRFFKRATSGHPVVMGRKTFDSIGKPLPARQNIVLTRDHAWSTEGVEVIHDPDELASLQLEEPNVFIMGGAEIYSLFLPLLDELLISWVHGNHRGDTIFPEFEDQFPGYELVESYPEFEVRRYRR